MKILVLLLVLALRNSVGWSDAFTETLVKAEKGDVRAQYNLGVMYANGQDIPKNAAKALEWTTKSAENGFAVAQYNLGLMYDNGQGVPKNSEKALEWYRKAAKQVAESQQNSGVMVNHGEGVLKNEEKSIDWKKSAEQGLAKAQENLGVIVDDLMSLTSNLFSEPVKVLGTDVTFHPPEGFNPLSKEVIATKWPTKQAPTYVIGNSTASTTVAYDLKPHNISPEELPNAQKSFTLLMERIIPGIEWKKNEIIELSGQKWILMEMTSRAVDTDIYNIVLMTGIGGKMLIFNFNSTKEDFPKVEAQLRKSIKSIKLPLK